MYKRVDKCVFRESQEEGRDAKKSKKDDGIGYRKQ